MLLGRVAGLTEEKLSHLGDDPLPEGVYEPSERAIVRYAQASTRNDPITDELYADLSAHYSVDKMIEICFTVGLSNLINRFHATFLTDVDQMTQDALAPSCPLPLPPARR